MEQVVKSMPWVIGLVKSVAPKQAVYCRVNHSTSCMQYCNLPQAFILFVSIIVGNTGTHRVSKSRKHGFEMCGINFVRSIISVIHSSHTISSVA